METFGIGTVSWNGWETMQFISGKLCSGYVDIFVHHVYIQLNFDLVPSRHTQSERLARANSQSTNVQTTHDGGAELTAIIEEAVELEMTQ